MKPATPSRAATALLVSLYERLPMVLALNLAVAIGTVVVFAGQQSAALLAFWQGLMLVVIVLRLKSWHDFRQLDAAMVTTQPWTRRFTLGAGATGAVWGLVPILFYAPDSLVAQIVVPFILAGMVGGSLVVLTGSMPAFVAFFVCALTPYCLRLAFEGDLPHLTMATLVALYMVGVGFLGRGVNASLQASVRLAAENEELVAALQQKSAHLEATFNHVNQGVAVFERDGGLVTWNPRHRELHGYPAELYRAGTPIGAFVEHDVVPAGLAEDAAATFDIGQLDDGRRRFEQRGAGDRVLEVEHSPMPDGGFVSTSTDITERKQAESRMLHLAQHDSLTGVPNRLLFQDRLSQAIARCRRNDSLLAIMLVDLDNFKQVNDVLGHRVGDEVLKEMARRLRAGLRESDTVARIGGDEFALILPDLADAEAAALVAGKISARLTQPFELDARGWQPRASIGISLFPSDGETAEQLIQNADLAMYRAKAAGGGFRQFAVTIKRDFDRRQTLERELPDAIGQGQLGLEFRPQLDLAAGRIDCFASRLRWQHPELGRIDPESLVRIAQSSGQQRILEEWALAEACRAAASWPSEGAAPPRVAVDLPTSQLVRPDLVQTVVRALDGADLPPTRLDLELAESRVFGQAELIAEMLGQLRSTGVRLVLAGFGTGHGGLDHLRRTRFDALKIDRTFVVDLGHAPDCAIVRSVIELGHRLGLRVIAQGVDRPPQLAALRQLGCDGAEGELVGTALAATAVRPWLNERLAS